MPGEYYGGDDVMLRRSRGNDLKHNSLGLLPTRVQHHIRRYAEVDGSRRDEKIPRDLRRRLYACMAVNVRKYLSHFSHG
jgi:hypothetical protein